MNTDRRSDLSIGARMRHQHPLGSGWGAWAPSQGAPAAPRRKVLVAGASADARRARRAALSKFEIDVVEAADAEQARIALAEHEFALIVADVDQAPASEGLPALLRLDANAQGVPVIMVLPATAEPARLHALYEIGAADCLIDAPLDPEILRHKACVYFEMHGTRAALRAAAERVQEQQGDLEMLSARLRDHQELQRQQATHDSLTGLPNEALFEDRLDGALKRARRSGLHVALALVNLDGFRRVNEQCGFSAGDEVILATARRLVQAVRTSDTVARLDGDEFAIVLENLNNAAAADYVAHKMARAIGQPCRVLADPHGSPTEVVPRASIGIAVVPDHAREGEELVTAAAMTLREVKLAGGGTRVYQGGVLVRADGPVTARHTRVAGIRKG